MQFLQVNALIIIISGNLTQAKFVSDVILFISQTNGGKKTRFVTGAPKGVFELISPREVKLRCDWTQFISNPE